MNDLNQENSAPEAPTNNQEPADDLIVYVGSINRAGYLSLTKKLEKRAAKAKSVTLLLATFGGDPDAAFRIARALRHHYPHLVVMIAGPCKSAGTLVAIGANELLIADRGELGPLDIQLSKPDEIFESMSGLDVIQALSMLESRTLSSFRRYLMDIRGRSGMRTKLAAELAVQLTQVLVGPIVAKLDPVMLGDHQRKIQIAMDYGERLDEYSKNLQPGALQKLVGSYPSHGFVIDRKEAKKLFVRVAAPDGAHHQVCAAMADVLQTPTDSEHGPTVFYIDDEEEDGQASPHESQ